MTTSLLAVGHETKVMDRLKAYSHPSLLARLSEKCHLSPNEAAELFEDTKLFLYLASVESDDVSPPEMIDVCWHEFLLFTKDYSEFCQHFFHEFIHHRPRYLNDVQEEQYPVLSTISSAKARFGALSKNWNIQKGADCTKCGYCKDG